jgi:hypothetical protein
VPFLWGSCEQYEWKKKKQKEIADEESIMDSGSGGFGVGGRDASGCGLQ